MSQQVGPYRGMQLVPPAAPPERTPPRPRGWWARWRCRRGWHRAQDCIDTGKWITWKARLNGGPLYECLCGARFCLLGGTLVKVLPWPEHPCGNPHCVHQRRKHLPRSYCAGLGCVCTTFIDDYVLLTEGPP